MTNANTKFCKLNISELLQKCHTFMNSCSQLVSKEAGTTSKIGGGFGNFFIADFLGDKVVPVNLELLN